MTKIMIHRFYEEPEYEFYQFSKYYIRILLHFIPEIGREDTFKPAIGNESLHNVFNDNVRVVVSFVTSKNLIASSVTFQHCYIHKYTSWTSSEKNQINHVSVERK
jgi:hypothetical protein